MVSITAHPEYNFWFRSVGFHCFSRNSILRVNFALSDTSTATATTATATTTTAPPSSVPDLRASRRPRRGAVARMTGRRGGDRMGGGGGLRILRNIPNRRVANETWRPSRQDTTPMGRGAREGKGGGGGRGVGWWGRAPGITRRTHTPTPRTRRSPAPRCRWAAPPPSQSRSPAPLSSAPRRPAHHNTPAHHPPPQRRTSPPP